LTPLIDAAVSDVAKARENIEGWFNTSMDRVSSWYKRRTQVVILILGLFVAIAVNADSITLVKRLSTDRALRESLVSAAEKHAQAHATARPSPATSPEKEAGTPESLQSPASPAKSSPAAGSSKSTSEGTSRAASESTSGSKATAPAKASPTPPQACVDDKESEECKFEEKLLKIQACREDRNSPECRYKENLLKIQGLGLPIGWDVQDDLKRKWPGWSWKRPGGWWDQIYWHGLGWLLTAFAISLGAPFWFDLLNKFIVIRSAVKPHEKSPEEESKD
jgi:hypothetical protein